MTVARLNDLAERRRGARVSHIVFGFFAAGKSLRRACKSLTLIATALIATCVGSLFATQAWAIDVASQTDWNTAVAAVAAAGAGTTVTINITGGFTLTSSLAQLQASAANVTVNITGNGQTPSRAFRSAAPTTRL